MSTMRARRAHLRNVLCMLYLPLACLQRPQLQCGVACYLVVYCRYLDRKKQQKKKQNKLGGGGGGGSATVFSGDGGGVGGPVTDAELRLKLKAVETQARFGEVADAPLQVSSSNCECHDPVT